MSLSACVLTAEYCLLATQLGRSQWPRGIRHEPSSLARTLGSRVRIPRRDMDVCMHLFGVCVVLSVGSGLATR
jgi:hypothetical protein